MGASGSIAGYVIEELQKQKDVHLTLFLRNKKRLHNPNLSNATIVEGDVMNYQNAEGCYQWSGHCLCKSCRNLEAMAKNIVKAMQETGVQRIIAISSIGIYKTPLQSILIPYRKLADVIEASGLGLYHTKTQMV